MVGAFVALFPASAAGQRHIDAFRTGMTAFDQRRWDEAARQFEIAAQAKSDSDERVRLYGMRSETYLPHYFLGVALFQKGDFLGAITAFDAADRAGAVRKNAAYYGRLQDLRKQAAAKTMVAAVTTSTVATTSMPATSTTTTVPVAVVVPPTGGTTSIAAADGSTALLAAQQAIQKAIREQQALQATTDIKALRQLDGAVARLEQQAIAQLNNAMARLDASNGSSADDLREVMRLANEAADAFGIARQTASRVVQRVTEELIAATKPYFVGQYSAARTALDRLNYPPSRFAVQLWLFQAAASYSLYAIDGRRDETLRREAERKVRECRGVAAGFTPDARVFSPKFVQFFNAVK